MKKYIQLIILLIVANSYAQNPVPFDTIYTQEITATKFHLGQRGKVTLEIDDAGHDGLITNPLIVAEGFDPGSITSPEKEFGDSDLEDFIERIQDGNSVDLDNLTINNTNQRYDLIYVNWTNGTDDIKENAKVLKAVIDWVNTNKQGDEPNVLLGQSMGGLIGRYTLAKMEKDGQHHDVRLFIAHDSPKVSEKSKLLKIPSKI